MHITAHCKEGSNYNPNLDLFPQPSSRLRSSDLAQSEDIAFSFRCFYSVARSHPSYRQSKVMSVPLKAWRLHGQHLRTNSTTCPSMPVSPPCPRRSHRRPNSHRRFPPRSELLPICSTPHSRSTIRRPPSCAPCCAPSRTARCCSSSSGPRPSSQRRTSSPALNSIPHPCPARSGPPSGEPVD